MPFFGTTLAQRDADQNQEEDRRGDGGQDEEPVRLAEGGQYQNEVDEIAAGEGVRDARRRASRGARTDVNSGPSLPPASSAGRRTNARGERSQRPPPRRTRAASVRRACARAPDPSRRRPRRARHCRPRNRAGRPSATPGTSAARARRRSRPRSSGGGRARRRSACTAGRRRGRTRADAGRSPSRDERHRVRRDPRVRQPPADRQRDVAVEVPRHEALRVLDEAAEQQPLGARHGRPAVATGTPTFAAPRRSASSSRTSDDAIPRQAGGVRRHSIRRVGRRAVERGANRRRRTGDDDAREARAPRREHGAPDRRQAEQERGRARPRPGRPAGRGRAPSRRSPPSPRAGEPLHRQRRAALPAGFLGEVHEVGAERRLREVAARAGRLRDLAEKFLDHAVEPVGVVRALRQRRELGLLDEALLRVAALEPSAVEPSDCPCVPDTSTRFRAIGLGPRQEDLRGRRRRTRGTGRRCPRSATDVPAGLEPRRDGPRRTGHPLRHGVERVPAVVHEDAASGLGRIDAPVRVLPGGRRRARGAWRLPRHAPDLADGSVAHELGDAREGRRVLPVVHGDERPLLLGRRAPGSPRSSSGEITSGFSQSTCSPQDSADRHERRVRCGRRADVDEVELVAFDREELLGGVVPAGGREDGRAAPRGVRAASRRRR